MTFNIDVKHCCLTLSLILLLALPTLAQPLYRDDTTTTTTTTSTTTMKQEGLPEKILGQPWIYLCISLLLVFLIISKWKKKDERPEEKLFWGVEIREKMTHKIMDRYVRGWGEKTKFKLFRGHGNPIGIVMRVLPIYKRKINNQYVPLSDDEIKKLLKKKYEKERIEKTEVDLKKEIEEIKELILSGDKKYGKRYGEKKEQKEELSYYLIAYREPGIIGFIKWFLLHRYEKLLIDPQALTIDEIKKTMYLDPQAWIHDHSGVWTLGTKKENILIDELNLQKDIENLKGYTSDMARRVSNQNAMASIINERLTHESELKEKERRSKLLHLSKG